MRKETKDSVKGSVRGIGFGVFALFLAFTYVLILRNCFYNIFTAPFPRNIGYGIGFVFLILLALPVIAVILHALVLSYENIN